MQTDFNINLGKKIREIRRTRSISLSKLAEQMHVSYQQLQKYETGTNRISAEKLFEIAQFLNIEPQDFFPNYPLNLNQSGHDKFLASFTQIKSEETKKLLVELVEKFAKF